MMSKKRFSFLGAFAFTLSSFAALPFASAQDSLYWVGAEGTGPFPPDTFWGDAANWSRDFEIGLGGDGPPGVNDVAIFGGATPPPATGALSTDVSLIDNTNVAGSVEFVNNTSFSLVKGSENAAFTIGRDVSQVGLPALREGIHNKGSGSQVIHADLNFRESGVAGLPDGMIVNSGTGSMTFLGVINADYDPDPDPEEQGRVGSLMIQSSAGSLNFATINATQLHVVHTGGIQTYENAVEVATGDSLSVAGTGAINFDGGLTLANEGSFTFALDSSAEINASTLSLDPGFLTKLDLTGYSNLQELEGKQWVVFNIGSSTNPIPDSYQFSFVAGTEIDGLTTDDFMWQFDSTDSGGGTITLVSLASIPEPSTIVLLGVAGAIGGVVARRRKKMATNDQAEEAVVA